MRGGRRRHGAGLRQSNRHAEPEAAGHDDRGGARATGDRILARAARRAARFEPLMTLYLTDNTSADEIARAKASRIRARGQVLPRRRDDQLRLRRHARSSACTPALAAMERHGVVLSIHGEVTDPGRRRVRSRARVRRARSSRAIVRDFPGAAHRARAHHDARGRRVRARSAAPTSPRRSRRSICSTRATRCSPAACGRTCTACRC